MILKIKSLKHEIDNFCTAEGLFFTGFIIFLARGMWETTMLPFNGLVSQMCLMLSILFIGLKIILFDTYSVGEYIGVIIGFGCTILIFLNSKYLNPFFWVLILIGCKDISFEKILKIYLLITASITILAFCAALLGVIENLIYQSGERGVRIAFGSVYVTDFASHIFYMILTYCYLKAEKLKIYHYVGILVITGLVYYFCKARLDCISMLLVVIVFGINQRIHQLHYDGKKLLKKWGQFWSWFGLLSMPLFALVSLGITAGYQENSKLFVLIDKIIANRLRYGKMGLVDYGITFWGQLIKMTGAGGAVQLPVDYFFIDCSYVHILLRYGLVYIIGLLTVYVFICVKNKNSSYLLIVIALISLNCMIAHHIIDIAYNPFACALLAQYSKTK